MARSSTVNGRTKNRIIKAHHDKEYRCLLDRDYRYSAQTIEWIRQYWPNAICPCPDTMHCAAQVRRELKADDGEPAGSGGEYNGGYF